MKITICLLTICFLHASAGNVLGQSVTLTADNMPLKKVFSIVKKQTGYVFFYQTDMLKAARPVTLSVSDMPLPEFLQQVFNNQPLEFDIRQQTIVLSEKTGVPSSQVIVNDTTGFEIRGMVFNQSRQPLESATVTLKRNNKNTLTNERGEFTLKGVQPGNVLVISYIGYVNKTFVVQDNHSVDITMTPATSALDEIVVQAYGTTSQRLTTGNIVKVTAAEIQRQPVMNPLLALQGKVAGLDVTQTSGYASAPVKLELRGKSAISNNFHSDPLYIIDGVPLSITALNDGNYLYGSPGFIQNGLTGPANGQSPLFSINPSDIESIEVLKDADATAIYGSRGANGVILITTKKGKPGKTNFNLRAQQGITRVTRFFSLLNTQQYLAMRREAFKNDGTTPNRVSDYDVNGTWDTTRYTNWEKALYGGTGKVTNVEADLSGGNAQTTFRLGAGYSRTTSLMTVDGSDQRSSMSLSLNHRSANQRFSASLTNSYSINTSNLVDMPSAVTLAPNAPAIFDSAGNLNFSGWGGANNNASARGAFPFSTLKQRYTAKTNVLITSLILSYRLIKGLNLSSSFGYNNAQVNQTRLIPIASKDPQSSPLGNTDWGNNWNRNWIIEPKLNYNIIIGKGKLDALVGGTFQQTSTDAIRINGDGYTSDDLLGTLSAAPKLSTFQFTGEYRYAAVFGRVTYDWSNKYLLNLTARRDGSSRFGSGNQYGNFGSIGAAWIFSEEKWLKDHFSLLSFGKLRASYGTTGSDAVGDYQYLTQYSSVGTNAYDNQTSLSPRIAANPDFRWQVNKKLEIAINLGFLGDFINIQVAYYRDRCGNQLIDYPLPYFSGFPSVTANSGALVQNTGFEYSGNFRIMQHKKFSWTVDFNVAVNRNKLVAYPDFNLSPYVGVLFIGQPLNIQRLLHYTGVDPQTGKYDFEDRNHDGQITYDVDGKPDDTRPVSLAPSFFGGLGMNFNYQSFQLNLVFNFRKQKGLNAMKSLRYPGTLNANQPVDVLDRWQQPGDNARFAAYTTKRTNFNYSWFANNSDGVFTDASFVRLSNVALQYNLPARLFNNSGIRGVSVFARANNILVFTKYKGIDPETQNFSGLPPTRTIVGGLSFNF